MNFSMISVQPAKSYLSGPCAGRLKEHTLDKRRKCEYFVISSSVHPGLNENLFWCAIINQNVHSWNLIPKDGCRGDAESTQNMKGRKYMPRSNIQDRRCLTRFRRYATGHFLYPCSSFLQAG